MYTCLKKRFKKKIRKKTQKVIFCRIEAVIVNICILNIVAVVNPVTLMPDVLLSYILSNNILGWR